MNVSRMCLDGTVHPEETLNKSQIYVTTAGWKGTFSYDKLITLLIRMVLEPEKAIIMGGTYRIPVLVKLLDKNFVQDLKRDGTFNEASFDREYKTFVLFKILRIAGISLELYKLQRKVEKNLIVNVKNYKDWTIRSRALTRGRFND